MGKRKYDSTAEKKEQIKRTKNTRKSKSEKMHGPPTAVNQTEFETVDELPSYPDAIKRRNTVTPDIVDIGNGSIIIKRKHLEYKATKLKYQTNHETNFKMARNI